MKTKNFITRASILVCSIVLVMSCESNPEVESQKDLLPAKFRVDIPTSISQGETGGRIANNGRQQRDSIRGNDIYKHLGTFIGVGKAASHILEEFINGIRK